jgi:oligopeptide/dipeptide ABC transporter ATP-binding protein
VMYLGRIVELASARSLYRRPRHPYTEALLSAAPVPEPGARRARIRLQGELPNPLHPPTGCPFHPRCPHATERCRTETPALKAAAENHIVACHLHDSGAAVTG